MTNSGIIKMFHFRAIKIKRHFCVASVADNKMVEALSACEPDMLQVSNISHTLDTDQRVLGQLSDLYDRELVGIIGNHLLPSDSYIAIM